MQVKKINSIFNYVIKNLLKNNIEVERKNKIVDLFQL